MPLQCYNCNEPGHRAADCPHACFRCGGDHWFAKCPAPGEVELERLFAQFDAGQKGACAKCHSALALADVRCAGRCAGYLDRSDIAAALRHYKLPQGALLADMRSGPRCLTRRLRRECGEADAEDGGRQ